MLKKIISVLYLYYSKSVFEDAYYASILLIVAIQQLWLFTLLEFIKRMYGKEFTIIKNNIYIIIPLSIIWAWSFFKIYPKKNVLKYVEEFKMDSKLNQIFWKVLSIILITLPLFTILFYF